jgi:hypothetical protein
VYKRKAVVEKPEKVAPNKRMKRGEVSTSGRPVGRPKSIRRQAVLEEDDKPDLFSEVYLNESSLSSRGSSRTPSKKSKSVSSKLSSLSSLASDLSSEKSISTAKSSSVKSSKSSSKGSDSGFGSDLDLSELDFDIEDYNPDKVLRGKGINKISTNNNMANSWITYVKEYAAKNGMSYRDALRDPNCKVGYKKGGVVKKGRGVIDEIEGQDLIADVYNNSQLGANAGKKFISL